MKGLFHKDVKHKHLLRLSFKSHYCRICNQKRPCRALTEWKTEWKDYCCACYYQTWKERTPAHLSYEEVLASQQVEQEKSFRQLQLLKSYRGCRECGSEEVDARFLYEELRLVCQSCWSHQGEEESWTTSPISFREKWRWFKKKWGIDLIEWLEHYRRLPVNSKCAERWRKDAEHLINCDCLEAEVQASHSLFANLLSQYQTRLEKDCWCEESKKVRVAYLDSEGKGWTYCEKCEKRIKGAGHHGVIKNRNDPRFWGLKIEEKVLCGDCLACLTEEMPASKKYTFNKYNKRRYWI